jgi:hypothetical protein
VFSSGSQSTLFRPRESSVDANLLRNSTGKGPAVVTNEAAAEEEALGADTLNSDETGLGQEEHDEEKDETSDIPDESACEIEDHNESDAKESGTLEEDSGT